jgi:flagellin
MNVLTGAFARAAGGNEARQLYFQVGANMDQRERVYIGTMTARGLGLQAGAVNTVSVSAPDPANRTIGIVDSALRRLSQQRADLGAYQNRFEMAAKGVAVASENMQAAESLIRDADIAAQMVEYVKDSILVQSSTAMLAQANLKPRSVLQLLA